MTGSILTLLFATGLAAEEPAREPSPLVELSACLGEVHTDPLESRIALGAAVATPLRRDLSLELQGMWFPNREDIDSDLLGVGFEQIAGNNPELVGLMTPMARLAYSLWAGVRVDFAHGRFDVLGLFRLRADLHLSLAVTAVEIVHFHAYYMEPTSLLPTPVRYRSRQERRRFHVVGVEVDDLDGGDGQ